MYVVLESAVRGYLQDLLILYEQFIIGKQLNNKYNITYYIDNLVCTFAHS